jgi:hypothetical protein
VERNLSVAQSKAAAHVLSPSDASKQDEPAATSSAVVVDNTSVTATQPHHVVESHQHLHNGTTEHVVEHQHSHQHHASADDEGALQPVVLGKTKKGRKRVTMMANIDEPTALAQPQHALEEHVVVKEPSVTTTAAVESHVETVAASVPKVNVLPPCFQSP